MGVAGGDKALALRKEYSYRRSGGGGSHCCPTYSLSLRERVGEREKIELTAYFTPLSLALSLWERGCSFCIVVTGIYVDT